MKNGVFFVTSCFSFLLFFLTFNSIVAGNSPVSSSSSSDSPKAINIEDMIITDVVVAIAMEAEAKPFIEHLGLTKEEDYFPKETSFEAFTGKYSSEGSEGIQVTVVTNGKDHVYDTGVDNVGTVPASLITFLTLQKLKDKKVLLINAGTCGGFKRMGAAIGDAFVVTEFANHDRRIPIPVFTPYGIGNIKFDNIINTGNLISAHGFKQGVCTTGNSLDKTDRDDELMKDNNASVKDMEAAAIAWSCKLHKVPMIGIKVVTDIVDGDVPTQDEFLANLQAASKSLQEALPKVLQYVAGKTHDEL